MKISEISACKNFSTVNWFINRLHNILLAGLSGLGIDSLVENHCYWLQWVLSIDNAKLLFSSGQHLGLLRCDRKNVVKLKCSFWKSERCFDYHEDEIFSILHRVFMTEASLGARDRCLIQALRDRAQIRLYLKKLYKDQYLDLAKKIFRSVFVGSRFYRYLVEAYNTVRDYVVDHTKDRNIHHPLFLTTCERLITFAILALEEPLRGLGIGLLRWLKDRSCCQEEIRNSSHYRANRRIRYNWLVDLLLAKPALSEDNVCHFTEIEPSELGKVLLNESEDRIHFSAIDSLFAPRYVGKHLAFDILAISNPNIDQYIDSSINILWEVYQEVKNLVKKDYGYELGPLLDQYGHTIKNLEEYRKAVKNALREYIELRPTDIEGIPQIVPKISREALGKSLCSLGS